MCSTCTKPDATVAAAVFGQAPSTAAAGLVINKNSRLRCLQEAGSSRPSFCFIFVFSSLLFFLLLLQRHLQRIAHSLHLFFIFLISSYPPFPASHCQFASRPSNCCCAALFPLTAVNPNSTLLVRHSSPPRRLAFSSTPPPCPASLFSKLLRVSES